MRLKLITDETPKEPEVQTPAVIDRPEMEAAKRKVKAAMDDLSMAILDHSIRHRSSGQKPEVKLTNVMLAKADALMEALEGKIRLEDGEHTESGEAEEWHADTYKGKDLATVRAKYEDARQELLGMHILEAIRSAEKYLEKKETIKHGEEGWATAFEWYTNLMAVEAKEQAKVKISEHAETRPSNAEQAASWEALKEGNHFQIHEAQALYSTPVQLSWSVAPDTREILKHVPVFQLVENAFFSHDIKTGIISNHTGHTDIDMAYVQELRERVRRAMKHMSPVEQAMVKKMTLNQFFQKYRSV